MHSFCSIYQGPQRIFCSDKYKSCKSDWKIVFALVKSMVLFMSREATSLGCSIPNTYMEFRRGRPRTGCRLKPLVSIQNPDSEKFQEVSEKGLDSFSVLKKNRVPGMGGIDAEVKLLPDNLRLFSGLFWLILANPGYFLANPGYSANPGYFLANPGYFLANHG